jgi:hypothetical protein
MLPLTVLPRPSLVHEFFRAWARLLLFGKATPIPSLHLICCSHNFPPRHSLAWCRRCSIASSWNLSTKCVMRFIHILTPSETSTEFMIRMPSLPLNDFWYHWQHPWLPTNTDLVMFWLYHWVPFYTWNCSFCIFLWSSDPTLTWNTILLLPLSMTVVFRISTRTLEAQC